MGAAVFGSLAFDVGRRKLVIFRVDRTDLPHLTCSWNNPSKGIDIHLTSPSQASECDRESILKIQESELRARFRELLEQLLAIVSRSPIQFIWGVQPKWLADKGYRLVGPRDEPVSVWFKRSLTKKRGKYRLDAESFRRPPEMVTYSPTAVRLAKLRSEGQAYAFSTRGPHRGTRLMLTPLSLDYLPETWAAVDMADVGRLVRAVKRSRLLPRWFSELSSGGWERIYLAMRLEELGL
jgi:hypothetical protein